MGLTQVLEGLRWQSVKLLECNKKLRMASKAAPVEERVQMEDDSIKNEEPIGAH